MHIKIGNQKLKHHPPEELHTEKAEQCNQIEIKPFRGYKIRRVTMLQPSHHTPPKEGHQYSTDVVKKSKNLRSNEGLKSKKIPHFYPFLFIAIRLEPGLQLRTITETEPFDSGISLSQRRSRRSGHRRVPSHPLRFYLQGSARQVCLLPLRRVLS